jgi:hypothetical protein
VQQQQQQQQESELNIAAAAAARAELPAVQVADQQCSANAPYASSGVATGNCNEEHVVVMIRPATAAGAAAV